ncbi:hypothetical protein [Burkholderia ambifaria]|uniref:hypothetical protein n=1 Tax=Burkholderia ambifaria TaxID=152480 RepID=UPI00030640BD|nr:hypothetical protein [Burkholderia ambifaria]
MVRNNRCRSLIRTTSTYLHDDEVERARYFDHAFGKRVRLSLPATIGDFSGSITEHHLTESPTRTLAVGIST